MNIFEILYDIYFTFYNKLRTPVTGCVHVMYSNLHPWWYYGTSISILFTPPSAFRLFFILFLFVCLHRIQQINFV